MHILEILMVSITSGFENLNLTYEMIISCQILSICDKRDVKSIKHINDISYRYISLKKKSSVVPIFDFYLLVI